MLILLPTFMLQNMIKQSPCVWFGAHWNGHCNSNLRYTIDLPTHPPTYLPIRPSVPPSIHPSVRPSVRPSIYPPTCLFTYAQIVLFYTSTITARGSGVGWGTMLQAGRSRVRVPMRWIFFNWPNPSSRTMALGSTQPLTEMSTKKSPRV
jgi:hypothetical protein